MSPRGHLHFCSVDDSSEDVGVAGVLNGENANSVHSAGGGAELDVVAVEVEDLGATEDGHILKLGSPDGGAVVRDEDELGLAVPQHLHHSLVACAFKTIRAR